MNDIQNILSITFSFVENLLEDYGEFYPLASVVKNDKTVDQFLTNDKDGNEFPKSKSVIERIKCELHLKQNDFIAFAIFYDVKLKEKNTDAIAVYVEHKIESFAYTFYYPYKIIENKPKFNDSWKVIEQMEIFDS